MKVRLGEEIDLECQVCGAEEFDEREAQLNTAAMSFAGLDWLNSSAVCFICVRCGYVHWFLTKNSDLQPTRKKEVREQEDRWTPPI
jgi:predicted nucleic-acid-binding Zn-ribbon protein